MIICLAGRAGCGKDTSADYLVEAFGKRGIAASKIALADHLKRVVRELIKIFYGQDIPLEEFYDRDKKEEVRIFGGRQYTLRYLLQHVGSEIFRDMFSTDIWCRSLKIPDGMVSIITDCRFQTDIDYFKGYSIRIVRDVVHLNHQSEVNIDNLLTDEVIDNNGSFTELYAALDHIVDKKINS